MPSYIKLSSKYLLMLPIVLLFSTTTNYACTIHDNNIYFNDPDGYGDNKDKLYYTLYLLDDSDDKNYKVADSQADCGFEVDNTNIKAGRKQSKEVGEWISNTYPSMDKVSYAGANPFKSNKDKLLREKFNFATYNGTLVFFMNGSVYTIKNIGLSQHHSGAYNFWTIYGTGQNCQQDPDRDYGLKCKADGKDDYVYIRRVPTQMFKDPSGFIVSTNSMSMSGTKMYFSEMGNKFASDLKGMFDFKHNPEEALLNSIQLATIAASPAIGAKFKGVKLPMEGGKVSIGEMYGKIPYTEELGQKVINSLMESNQYKEPLEGLSEEMKIVGELSDVGQGESKGALARQFLESYEVNISKILELDTNGELKPQLEKLLKDAYPMDFDNIAKNKSTVGARQKFLEKLAINSSKAYRAMIAEVSKTDIELGVNTTVEINGESKTIGRIYDDQTVYPEFTYNATEYTKLKNDLVSDLKIAIDELEKPDFKLSNKNHNLAKYYLSPEIKSVLENPENPKFAGVKKGLSNFYSEITEFIEETNSYKDYDAGIQNAIKSAYNKNLKIFMENIKVTEGVKFKPLESRADIEQRLEKWFEQQLYPEMESKIIPSDLLDNLIKESENGNIIAKKITQNNTHINKYQEYLKRDQKSQLSKDIYAKDALNDLYIKNKKFIDEYIF